MRWVVIPGAAAAFGWTFGAMYGVERLADAYYSAGSPAFFTVSGLRLEAFIFSALFGALAGGLVLRSFVRSLITQGAAIASFFAFAYSLCDPRVCFSAGPDGLEPVRLGVLLLSISVIGCATGSARRSAGGRGVVG